MSIRELLKGESKGLLKLPTDKALVEDPEFRRYVQLYAEVNRTTKLVIIGILYLKMILITK